ncbi:MAG: carbon-nitrogen hydrolase family protein [Betaproteobacteria bacterium]|nr:carbon-nitrogen hydrolase family protein [Betaproteobacteria bacterium]
MPPVRVATVQYAIGQDVEQNLTKCLRFIDLACAPADGPKPSLILLPELCNHPSRYRDQNHAYEIALSIPGPFVDAVSARARTHATHIAMNATVKGPQPRVFDTTILIGPDGRIIGTHEKQYLFGHENDCISIGRNPGRVFETAIGRIGLYICQEGLIPESSRCLAVEGAQILLNPLNSGGPDEGALHVPARAAENRFWVISCNNVGPIPGGHARNFVGGSEIVDPMGRIVAKASENEEEVVYATIVPEEADDKRVGRDNDLLADRRPELYGLLTATNEEVPVCALPADEILPRVRVSAVQVSFEGEVSQTLDRTIETIREVASGGTRVVVLPELSLFDRDRIAADPAGSSRTSADALTRFKGLARETGIHIVASLVEADAGRYFSTAYLVGPTGEVIGKYRQVHLWSTERRWAAPGDDFPVFTTPFGRIGMMIGYDCLMPEAARILAFKGADIIAFPCAWRVDWEPRLGVVERAAENRLCLIAAARADSDVARGSMIIQADRFPCFPHWWIRSPIPAECSPGNGMHVSAGLAAMYGRDKRDYDKTDQVRNRRPEFYGALLRAPERSRV